MAHLSRDETAPKMGHPTMGNLVICGPPVRNPRRDDCTSARLTTLWLALSSCTSVCWAPPRLKQQSRANSERRMGQLLKFICDQQSVKYKGWFFSPREPVFCVPLYFHCAWRRLNCINHNREAKAPLHTTLPKWSSEGLFLQAWDKTKGR